MLINLDYYLIDYSNKYNIRCYMLPQTSILEVKTLVMEIVHSLDYGEIGKSRKR